MKSIKEIRNELNESKQEDIADLKALLKNPDPRVAKNYGGIEGYKKMIQGKIDRLMKEELEEAAGSEKDIENLRKAYEPLRDKKISIDGANKLRDVFRKFDKDEEFLLKLVKADIPFVSQLAISRLLMKHNVSPAVIRKLTESVEELEEALTRAQRIKRSLIAKRNKAKIQRALQRGKKKKASTETLQKRAKKKARDLLYTKLLKGRDRADVSAGEQERIEKKLDKMQGGINRIAKKLLPQLKKAEQEKLKSKSEK